MEIKKFLKSLFEGMSTFSIYRLDPRLEDILNHRKAMEKDAQAIASDWQAVGNDLRYSMRQMDKYKRQNK